jgi:hypothetical protein
MSSVRNELALANAQELINVRGTTTFPSPRIVPNNINVAFHLTQKTNDKCYTKCVTKPSTSLSSSEEVRVHSCFWHVRLKPLPKKFLGLFAPGRSYRLVFPAASTGTWKPVRNAARAALPIQPKN